MESKAEIAIKKGLKPLADLIWNQGSLKEPLESLALVCARENGGVLSVEDVLQGVRHILIGRILDDQNLWQCLRNLCLQTNMIKLNDTLLQDFMIQKLIHTVDAVIRFQLEMAICDAYHFVIKTVLAKELCRRPERSETQKIKPIPVAKKNKPFQKKRDVFGTLEDQFAQRLKKQ